jgi:D-lactate dehydrogenase
MRVAIFSAKSYERRLLDEQNAGHRHELVYFDTRLGPGTVALAAGFPTVSVVVNDVVDRDVLKQLAAGGTTLVATRSTGFNHIDLEAARELGVKVVRVVDYSPNSVAEFTVGLLLALNRKIPRAYNRTREGNFELDGLMGFDLVGRTVAVIGTGKIGIIVARIMAGFGCELPGFDVHHPPQFEKLDGRYAKSDETFTEADVLSRSPDDGTPRPTSGTRRASPRARYHAIVTLTRPMATRIASGRRRIS